jgi:hypothetical protein
MNPAMMLAVFAPRILVSQTFTADTTWVAPTSTYQLETLVGQGQAGGLSVSILAVNVFYVGSGSGNGPAANDWSNVQPVAAAALSTVNGGGSGSYSALTLFKYADGTESIVSTATAYNNAVAGSAAISYDTGWHTSGPITNSGSANIIYTRSNGADATGFGQTFAGGIGGPATPVSLTNIAIAPGASYPLTVPAGSSITITYYR